MPNENKTRIIIDIPISTILKVLGTILLLWLLYYIRDIVIIVFVSTLLAIAFNPMVQWMEKRKVPRVLGIIIIYLALFAVFFGAIALLIPPLSEEVTQISAYFPTLWEKFTQSFSPVQTSAQNTELMSTINKGLASLREILISSTGNVFSIIRTIFGNIITFILIFVLSFYFLIQEEAIKRAIKYFVSREYSPHFNTIVPRMQERIGRWLRGELILVVVVGVLILIGLRILNVKYFLVLALLAGIMEVIPYLGPFFSAIPAVVIAFSDSVWKGIAVIILYWLVQQAENHLIVPKVMQKAVGLNPIVIILVILIAAKLFGFLGIIIAVPTTAALSVIAKFIYEIRVLGKKPEEIFKEDV